MITSNLIRGPIQKAILDILANTGVDEWTYTGEIAYRIPLSVLEEDKECQRRFDRGDNEKEIRTNLAANRLGTILGAMRLEGLIVRENPAKVRADCAAYTTKHKYGRASVWRLGPMADVLKEEGVIA